MASALLASRNEPCWGDSMVYMRKAPNPNPNPKILSNPNPNFNARSHGIAPIDPLPASSSAATLSDDSSSLRPKPFAPHGRRSDDGRFVTYDLSNCSKKELRELKRRLVCELDQVRAVTSRIEARDIQRSAAVPRSGAPIEPKKLPTPPPPPSAAAKKLTAGMMKRCGQILTKLMKHSGAVWFNSPVDVVALNLYDYHQIIKNPMDLGTVKSRLSKHLYSSPAEFAADIRLTFNNALTYNPSEHIVHNLADQLLRHFESSFAPSYDKYEKQLAGIARDEAEKEEQRRRAISSWSRPAVPFPETKMRVEPRPVTPPPVPQLLQQQQQQPMVAKQPKPKAKDPNKRAMSSDEKQKLGDDLQELPQEKMVQLLQLIQKRNVETVHAGDEVEIDFEVMDNETLWELDRFVYNWKKAMSKIKRQELMTATTDPTPPPPTPAPALPLGSLEKSPPTAERSKKSEPAAAEEDVDIGDDLPATNYPSVDIGKDSSSSSSSGSDSSSDSESDSGSSSGSDSDGDGGNDDAESRAAGSRPSLQGN